MTRRAWTFADVLVAFAFVLYVLAFCTAEGWFGLTNWTAWFTAATAVYVVSRLVPVTAP